MFKLQTLLASTLLVGMTALASAADRPQTVGPKGEAPTPVATLELTDAEVAKVAEGNYTAAFAWHELYDWSNAVARGAKDEFERLGIKVVAETDAALTLPARSPTSRRSWPTSRRSSYPCRSTRPQHRPFTASPAMPA